ncbi:hypothetical protein MOQ_005665 [Trypanosoma cruzi marinkellei]|uniref:Uncharacterized protein n=1 Tax=Trypanosoma cruzi marinkellei TaxID=85056 RepID=K2NNU8_TRYCR|nr:hypothetical protein MOQ_005665 [Trypanosoma cruzi marinkellei]
MMPQEASRHKAAHFHPYGCEMENDFTSLAMNGTAVVPCSVERLRASSWMSDADRLMDVVDTASITPSLHPWWRRHVDGPIPASVFYSSVRTTPSTFPRAAQTSSFFHSAHDAVGDADCHEYHHRGDSALQRFWTTQENATGGNVQGAPESPQPATAWYQLNYGIPVSSGVLEQPYNIIEGADAPLAAPVARPSPERAAAPAVFMRDADLVVDRPAPLEETSGGIREELLALRRRLDAVEAACCLHPSSGDRRRVEATPPPPPQLSSVEETAAPMASVTASPAAPSSAPRSREPSASVTLERLMNAVRRARVRVKEQEQKRQMSSVSSALLNTDASFSTVKETGGGTPERGSQTT